MPCVAGVVRVYLRSGFGVTCTRRLHIKAQRPTATLCSSYLHGVAVFLWSIQNESQIQGF